MQIEYFFIRFPSMYISPRCNGNKPRITFKRVDFPAPLGPTIARKSPLLIRILMFLILVYYQNNNQYF